MRGKVDDDTLSSIKTKLNHFCEIDKTAQINTYPDKMISKIDKNCYESWQNEMRKKTYKHGKENRLFSIQHLNDIHNEICRMLDFAITNGYCKLNFARQSNKIGTPKEVKMSKMKKAYNTINFEQFLALLKASNETLKTYTHLFNKDYDKELERINNLKLGVKMGSKEL